MQKNKAPQATSPLATWLCYLENLHTSVIDLGLTRVKEVATRMQLLQPAPLVFTVAGTNGKGTTCCVLEQILIASGYRVGVYSSPHLIRYTERVRIQGKELTEEEHCRALAEINNSRGEISLTYFEFGTLSALSLFKQADLDVVILEVGLGGRLDATNIIDADVAVITTIDVDHTDWLGNDRQSIGYEKAGIFRRGKPAIVGESKPPQSVKEQAERLGAQLQSHGVEWNYQQHQTNWNWYSSDMVLTQLPLPHVPLQNAATALAALYYSPLSLAALSVKEGLERATLPGRFQQIAGEPLLILDVAHNPHAAQYLAKCLSSLDRKSGKIRAVIAMLSDKDIAGTLACLKSVVDLWYCASLDVPRGARAEELVAEVDQAQPFTDVVSAWRQAMSDAAAEDIVVVCGSFYTVAHVIDTLDSGRCSG